MNKKFKISFILTLSAAVSLLFSLSANIRDEQKRKADYIYMEAQKQHLLDNHDAYYSMLERVVELDTDNTAPGNELGMLTILLQSSEDTTCIDRGLEMLMRHHKAHPEDYYSSLRLATALSKFGMNVEALKIWKDMYELYPAKDEVSYNYANELLVSPAAEDKKTAIKVFDQLESSLGKSLNFTVNKINALLILADTLGAVNEINSFMEYAPKDVEGILTAGDLRLSLDQPDSALIYYNRACATDSTNGLAFYKLAEFYRETGDSVAYDREIFHAMGLSSLDVNTKAELLRTYIVHLFSDSTQVPRIHGLFGQLIEQHPHETAIHKLYASYLVSQQEYGKAAEQQSYALDIDHGQLSDWLGLLGLRLQAEEYQQGRNDAETAITYFGEEPELLWYKSMAELLDNSPDDALVSIRKALEQKDKIKNPELLSQFYTSAGDMFHKKEMPDSTFHYYDEALKINPGNVMAMNNYAYFLACEGKELERALEMSGKAIAAHPTSATNLDTYAWVQFKLHNLAVAKEYIDKAIENEEEPSAEVYHHAGDIYFLNGDPDGAVKFWKKALELEPDNKLLIKKIKNRAYSYD